MKKSKLLIVIIVLIITGIFFYLNIDKKEKQNSLYNSDTFGLSFEYPKSYFLALEKTFSGERQQHVIVLAEDTSSVRELFLNTESATEAPPTITINIFQNNLDNYNLKSFVEGTNFSNFKLSNGEKIETILDGQNAWRYRATGLYENDNLVVVRPDYVYMFTVFFNSPNDKILKDFDAILKTVVFTESKQNIVTSGDNAPPGSLHNLPVPEAVLAVKKYVSQTTGVSEGLVIVLTAYEKDWSDSCLGLGGPNESCLMVITPGYEISVQAGGKEIKFRTNSNGSVIRTQ